MSRRSCRQLLMRVTLLSQKLCAPSRCSPAAHLLYRLSACHLSSRLICSRSTASLVLYRIDSKFEVSPRLGGLMASVPCTVDNIRRGPSRRANRTAPFCSTTSTFRVRHLVTSIQPFRWHALKSARFLVTYRTVDAGASRKLTGKDDRFSIRFAQASVARMSEATSGGIVPHIAALMRATWCHRNYRRLVPGVQSSTFTVYVYMAKDLVSWSPAQARHLTLSVNAARAGAAGDEFFHQRQKKRLAEMAELRVRLKVERLADDVLIVFVKDDPEAQRSVETGTTLFHLGISTAKRSDDGGWLVIGNSTSKSSPFGLAIRTPTATGRGLRPSVSPRSASRTHK